MNVRFSDGSSWSLAAINALLDRRCEGGFHDLQILSNGQSTVLSGTQRSSDLPVVVKLTIAPGTAKSEAYFLDRWRASGVPVPNVLLADNTIRNHEPDILVMERVNGAPLAGFGHVSTDMAKRIAKLQSLMHRAGGQGYGRPDREQPWRGVTDTFSDEMEIEWERRLAQLAQHEMFRGQLRSQFLAATCCIESDCGHEKSGGTLTHSDLSMDNVLLNADGDIVIIDPNCRLTHPAMCAAYTFLRLSLGGQADTAHIYRASYLSDSGISEQVFGAALQLRTILSISTWMPVV
ncbi:aminoglycoside phosphotransferase family protein [Burkholderia anthina]|uniref:phosphotransferase family protein n=1 Tax=Burkholderia anthina TaxID=179879 RepID=UPI001CF41AF9|nr:phosphotransferase [Burkholderia anthina]MCA8093325.1 aminoglycoside phosphotransferase family protein [Burkholderia anthina]